MHGQQAWRAAPLPATWDCATGTLAYSQNSRPCSISGFRILTDHLKANAAVETSDDFLISEAQAHFAVEVAQATERQADIVRRRRKATHLAVRSKAQLLLLRAAMVELALGQSPNLLDDEVYPSEFNEQAVLGLGDTASPGGSC